MVGWLSMKLFSAARKPNQSSIYGVLQIQFIYIEFTPVLFIIDLLRLRDGLDANMVRNYVRKSDRMSFSHPPPSKKKEKKIAVL